MSYMTPTHIARLRADVQAFARDKTQMKLSEVIKHINKCGWQTAHGEMFAGWLEQQGFQVDRSS